MVRLEDELRRYIDNEIDEEEFRSIVGGVLINQPVLVEEFILYMVNVIESYEAFHKDSVM